MNFMIDGFEWGIYSYSEQLSPRLWGAKREAELTAI